ncbi:hypothetical protein MMC30_009347 [Trapelia coarctata]|nr:hypothetical protein [Trapelia coarctata]
MMLPSIHIYYVDSFGYLQETRGHHASNDWFNGTLGDARIKAVPLSALGSAYAGACTDRGGFGFVYFTALDHTLHQATWAQDNDLWVDKGSTSDFPDMRFDADYTATTDGGTFRMYGITHGLQIQEYVCPQCCQNSSATWQQGPSFPRNCFYYFSTANAPTRAGLTGTSVTDSSLRLCMSGVGGPRYLYYPDPTAQMRELINTGNQDGDGAPENWQDYIANLTTQSPLSGEPVGQAMRGSKMSMSAGFRGKTQQLWMFYQAEGSDVSVRIRDVPKPGQWSERVALPVGV